MSEDLDAFLEHHGIKGMHWGRHKARTASGPAPLSRAERRVANATAKVAAVKQQQKSNADHDKAVVSARNKLESHDNKLQTAKAQYRVDKHTKGKAAAKATLNKVKDERASNLRVANLETVKERTTRITQERNEALNKFLTDVSTTRPVAQDHAGDFKKYNLGLG